MKCSDYFYSICAATVLFISACQRPAPPAEEATADHFGFLTGAWAIPDVNRDYREEWEWKGSRLDGYAREVALGDTVFAEEMSIFNREGDGWVLSVKMSGQNQSNTVFFKLTSFLDGKLVFENPAHDFPKRITYLNRGSEILEAVVDGGQESDNRLEFRFKRVQEP